MKFARYLEDTQTPEWKKAYVDYRLLKKRITAIRRANETQDSVESPGSTQTNLGITSEASAGPSAPAPNVSHATISRASTKNSSSHALIKSQTNLSAPDPVVNTDPYRREPLYRAQTLPTSVHSSSKSNRAPSFSRLFSSSGSKSKISARRFTAGLKPHPYSELPLGELMPLLSPVELAFFTTLDAELEKIEAFYLAREKEMRVHTELLEQQLDELQEHRKLFEAAHAHTSGVWTSAMNTAALVKLKAKVLHDEEAVESAASAAKDKGKATAKKASGKLSESAASSTINLTNHSPPAHLDPDEFHQAKHALKKAVAEHYRGLEMLHNYRILNITGIRKALKKFQKVTKIAAQNAYMTEKVDKSAFASEANVRSMMDEMEEMYATRFAHGDKKKALNRLRSGPQHKSHHTSTFWSGLLLGLAVPALVSGLYHSYQQSTRDAIPGWDALLLVYGVLLVPTVFSLLVGLNILVWAQSRINYLFIFEFDLRTRLDHREYFETPSFLLATLCYAFWLSFAQIGSPSASPTLWPLVWLAFTATIMFDPLPVMFKPSRYWLLKNIGKLLTSGTRRVEFTDFWMGDQFCSLVFTLSNLYLIGCLYGDGFNSNWRQCASKSRFWPLSFVIATLPFLVRLVQSLKRYADSGLTTHIINGGKYAAGIVAYGCYFLWRHRGGGGGTLFVVWCIFQTIYSLYALSWDFLMDWSILRLDDVRYPLLRKELVYTNHVYLYYFAIISNTLIRFIWVIYIPSKGPDMQLRTFIGGSFEMLRRWQWNFYRVENEHLGNVDQYRVTREVPLPYSLEERRGDDADDDDEDSPPRTWFSQRVSRLRRQRATMEA